MGEQMGSRTTSGAIVEAVAVFDGVATTDVGNCLGSVERPPGERREFVRRGCREDAPAVVGGESAKLVNERAKPHGQGVGLAFAAAVHRVEGAMGTGLSGGAGRLGGKGPGRAGRHKVFTGLGLRRGSGAQGGVWESRRLALAGREN